MDEQASLVQCMDVVGIVVRENDVNGISSAERAIVGYLNTRSGEPDLLEGIEAVEAEIGNVEDVTRWQSGIADTLRAFLDAKRREVQAQ